MVVLAGNCRSMVTADCRMYGARMRELISWITCVDWKPGSMAGDGTLGKKSGFGTTNCCCTSPLKRCAASVLPSPKRS